MPISWSQRYAQRTQRMTSSAIRELLKVTEQSDVISFAGGLPAPDIFPVEEIAVATDRVLREYGPQALQYSTTEGYYLLREWIAQQTSTTGPQVSLDNILITSGSQQALDLLAKFSSTPVIGWWWKHRLTWAHCKPGMLMAQSMCPFIWMNRGWSRRS